MSLAQVHSEPKVGQTWLAKNGQTLTIVSEHNDLPLCGPYFKYVDIDGKFWYSRKCVFFMDFDRQV